MEVFKAKYVQETDGPPHIWGILGLGSEDRSIDLLDNPQEEVSIDALGTQREALVSKAEEEGMTCPGLSRKGCVQIGNTDLQGMLPPKLGLAHPAVSALLCGFVP